MLSAWIYYLEQVGRASLLAIGLSALSVKDDPLLLVLAANHIKWDKGVFNTSVMRVISLGC